MSKILCGHDPNDRPSLCHFRQVRQREDCALLSDEKYVAASEPEREVPVMRQTILVSAVVFLIFSAPARGQGIVPRAPFPSDWLPSGEVMYRQFCAACHGAHAQGNGPAAPTLKRQPPDLTTLAKRHGGKFPYDYVSSISNSGPALLPTVPRTCLRGVRSFKRSTRKTNALCRTGLETSPITWHPCNESSSSALTV